MPILGGFNSSQINNNFDLIIFSGKTERIVKLRLDLYILIKFNNVFTKYIT